MRQRELLEPSTLFTKANVFPFAQLFQRLTSPDDDKRQIATVELLPMCNVNAQETKYAAETEKCLQEISTHSIICNLENRQAWKILLENIQSKKEFSLLWKPFFQAMCGSSRHNSSEYSENGKCPMIPCAQIICSMLFGEEKGKTFRWMQ